MHQAYASAPSGRLRYAAAAVFMQVLLGVIYAWSIFRSPLAQLHGWSKAQTIAPYRYSLPAIAAGFGVGFAYVTPIATCIKWFPDKRGMIVGLAVMGFGLGPLLFGPLLEALIGAD